MYMVWHKKLGLYKVYPFKLQAVIWCFMHGFVYQTSRRYFFDENIEIINTNKKEKKL